MTLQEAHELQRRELMSLRAKVKRLENNFPVFLALKKKRPWNVISAIWSRLLKQRIPDTRMHVLIGK